MGIWQEKINDQNNYNQAINFIKDRLQNTNILETAICSYEYFQSKNNIKKTNKIVMDVGCGCGWFTSYLSSLDEVKVIYALDRDLDNFQNLKTGFTKIFKGNETKIKIIETDFSKIKNKKIKLDEIFFCASLHHFLDMKEIFLIASKLLKSNGKIYILNEELINNTRLSFIKFKTIISKIKTYLLKKELLDYKYEKHRVLYDINLGDWAYSYTYLYKIIQECKFNQNWIIHDHGAYRKKLTSGLRPKLFAIELIKK